MKKQGSPTSPKDHKSLTAESKGTEMEKIPHANFKSLLPKMMVRYPNTNKQTNSTEDLKGKSKTEEEARKMGCENQQCGEKITQKKN